MNIISYCKDRLGNGIVWVADLGFVALLLERIGIDFYTIFFTELIIMLAISVNFVRDLYKKMKFYGELEKCLESLDKKYLLSELVEQPEFLEGQVCYEILKETDKAMCDEIGMYKLQVKEYREYIEMWLHEVKTPIASMKLMASNNRNEVTDSMAEELEKVDYYLEQVLYYARSNAVDKDYIIKEIALEPIIKRCIRKNAKSMIQQKVKVDLGNLNAIVFADSKWLEFIINQIIVNSIKYHSEDAAIRFYIKEEKYQVILFIEDNGIGISAADLPRVLEKGYTGTTGRKFAKSTGMGLYLCDKLCNKMGLTFGITSEFEKGTTVSIGFPEYKRFKAE